MTVEALVYEVYRNYWNTLGLKVGLFVDGTACTHNDTVTYRF